MPQRRVNTPIPAIPNFIWQDFVPSFIFIDGQPTINSVVARRYRFGKMLYFSIVLDTTNNSGIACTDFAVHELPFDCAYTTIVNVYGVTGWQGAGLNYIIAGDNSITNMGCSLADGIQGTIVISGYYEVVPYQ